jgi:S-adenosyl methyltransferase
MALHRDVLDPGKPPEIDIRVPSPTRIYDYYLGGKDNYPADRKAAEKALSVVPHGRRVAQANRKFLGRAVKYMARNGIEQFIDLGTGIPTSPNVHDVARSVIPGARAVYVDNDPIVAVHNMALLADSGQGITSVRDDIRYPLTIIRNNAVSEIIDFDRPVGVLFVAVLHFVTDADNPYDAVAAFRDRVPCGSYLAISHITRDGTAPEVISTIESVYALASAPAVFRTRNEIGAFFGGYTLVKPGIVEVSDWRANGKRTAEPPALRFLGGVGRKGKES